MRTSPFHERLAELSETQLWEHWAGYLSAVKYQHSATVEYFATRNAVGVFDTSPLFKYRVHGPDAVGFLATVTLRDPTACRVGAAQYTAWCNDAGYVLEDGVILRVAEDEFWVTTVGRNLRYLTQLIAGRKAEVVDMSDQFAMLAVQGPHARNALGHLTDAVAPLDYFGLATTTVAGAPVTISRTGFTGDLGYEMWVRASDAVGVLDAVLAAGAGYNIIPIGAQALGMARLEAGLLLLGTDFESARHAWTDAQRETPIELGLAWMIPSATERTYVGKRAIEQERGETTSRWKTVGIVVDAAGYERLYNDEGLVAPKDGVYRTGTFSLYDADFNTTPDAQYVGYVTSFMFSPVLKRHIGLAKLPLDRVAPGSEVFLELVVSHRPKYVRAEVATTPFYNPMRKAAPHGKDTA